MISKVTIIADKKNKKSQYIKSFIKKNVREDQFQYKNLTIVVGGDGFMLQTLKKFYRSDRFFYGINSGNYGFLMNKFSKKNFVKNLSKLKSISISPLIMSVKTKQKVKKTFFALNEVSVLRISRQASFLSIKKNKKIIINKLVADGVLVCTPAGSTAYNFSVNGPILDLNSKKIAISPISPFRPRAWKSKILNENSVVAIKNLDPSKRPISAVADNIEVRNITNINIKMSKKIIFNLLFNSKKSLEKKNKLEQIKKEIF